MTDTVKLVVDGVTWDAPKTYTLLQACELGGADHADRLRGGRKMQRYDVARHEELVERTTAIRKRGRFGAIRIDHRRAHRGEPGREQPRDLPGAD